MTQTWYDLLFAHWPVPAAALRPLVPAQLELDTYQGQAWIGVVPFGMTGIHARGLPALPGLSAFLELNVRTYVTRDGRPGVYFFSLDAANRAAVWAARRWFYLPYHYARMSLRETDGWYWYRSRRIHRAVEPAEFVGRYRPVGNVFEAAPGSLDDWLTARYCLYSIDPRGRLFRGDIHHPPWPLQHAQAEIQVNTMTLPAGVRLPAVEPLLHFARKLKVLIWKPVRL